LIGVINGADLIRINRDGQEVSGDLGTYDVWDCEGEGKNRKCKFEYKNLMDYVEVTRLKCMLPQIDSF
jgi:hypothetical protein